MDLSDSDEDLETSLLDFGDGEEDVDDYICEKANSSKNQMKNQLAIVKQDYELLNTSGLIDDMQSDIEKIVNVTLISVPIARLLLNHFQWNVEKLVNTYHDSEDLNAFFLPLGVHSPSQKPVMHIDPVDPVTDCVICLKSVKEAAKATGFFCGHQFCESCCGRYFEAKVLYDGEANIKCPKPGCNLLIGDATVTKFIQGNVKHQFEMLITRTFVSSKPFLRYCQSEGCEYTIKAKKLEPLLVICSCGFESCLQCGEIWHETVTCVLLKNWIKSSAEDGESLSWWIKQNAKKCPKCAIKIEKNGGCNHMRCKSCSHEFCWLCMRNWLQHGTCNTCNQFKQNYESLLRKSFLLHYSTRYKNHIRSLQLERGIYNSIESKMLQSHGMEDLTTAEVLLKRAVESLRRSRQILISTYVFAYYANKSNQLTIFEGNQHDLELATENLSWLLEQEITSECVVDIKQKLQDQYMYCDQRRNVLLDHIREGYEKGYWKLPGN